MASDISIQHAAHSVPWSDKSAVLGFQVLGTGAYAPTEVVTNSDLIPLGYDPAWIVQRTGIRERRRAAAHEATSDLAYEAAVRALADAGASAREVDLILVATMTPDSPTPSTACLVQQRLQAPAAAMDLNAACSGFMYALVTGAHFAKAGAMRRVLVIGADLMSRSIHPEDRKTFPLFGDGAGAVLLGAASEDHGLLAYTLGADGSGADLLCIPGGGTREPLTAAAIADRKQYMKMDGRSVFKWAVRQIGDALRHVMEQANVAPDDIDLVVLHQANVRILDAAMENFGWPRERVFVNLDRFGNTSAGSIPLALDEARRAGKIHSGAHILLCGFGAGLSWGAAVLRW